MSAEQSPIVTDIGWGRVDVAGAGTFKDVKLFPGGAREWDWAETGTRHRPGIQPEDVTELITLGCTTVILSRGMDLQLRCMPDTLAVLGNRGIVTHVLETREAVRLYNELAPTTRVGALIHSTC